jgi:hypothetical protein
MSDLFLTDFCHFYKELNRTQINIDNPSKLFTTHIDESNVLEFGDFSFLVMQNNEKENELINQVMDYLDKHGQNICRNELNKDYIEYALSRTKYKFLAVKKSKYECQIFAFKLLRDFESHSNLHYLSSRGLAGKYRVLQSVLLCAMPQSETIMSIVKNPSFGSYLTYLTVKWAIKKGYQYYTLKAADFDLLMLYRKWGFHFGLPHLNLDVIVDLVMDPGFLEKVLETNLQYDQAVELEIIKEIDRQLRQDWRKAKIVLDINKEEWSKKLLTETNIVFYEEAKNIMDAILENKDTYMMYQDLYSKDVDVLREYSKRKMVY